MTTQTSVLTLKTAIGPYGHHQALKDGSLKLDNIQFEHVEVTPIINAFRRMCRGLEFDVCEMAITTYLTAKAYKKPFTAIPVFPVRNFAHNATMVNVNAGVNSPKDLEGKKVGVRAYTVTTGVWARGILNSEYGVDLDKVTWVLADEEHVDDFHADAPSNAEYQLGADLNKMLTEGELAGGIGIARGESPELKPLIADARAAAKEYYQKTGVHPINHTIVIKDELIAANPWLPKALFEAFKEAKRMHSEGAGKDEARSGDAAIVEGDLLPYGIEKNRAALQKIIDYARNQHIIPNFKIEDVFEPSTHALE